MRRDLGTGEIHNFYRWHQKNEWPDLSLGVQALWTRTQRGARLAVLQICPDIQDCETPVLRDSALFTRRFRLPKMRLKWHQRSTQNGRREDHRRGGVAGAHRRRNAATETSIFPFPPPRPGALSSTRTTGRARDCVLAPNLLLLASECERQNWNIALTYAAQFVHVIGDHNHRYAFLTLSR
jgi:hypothetical protein